MWVVLATLLPSSTALAYHKVAHVYGGDTVLLENGTRIRYPGVDTPEIDPEEGRSDVMAEEVRDVNGKMAEGVPVRLEYDTDC